MRQRVPQPVAAGCCSTRNATKDGLDPSAPPSMFQEINVNQPRSSNRCAAAGVSHAGQVCNRLSPRKVDLPGDLQTCWERSANGSRWFPGVVRQSSRCPWTTRLPPGRFSPKLNAY